MQLQHRLLVPHSKKCTAYKQIKNHSWDTVWCLLGDCLTGETHYRGDSMGRKGRGYRSWIVAQCNTGSDDCPARLAVKEADIFKYLPKY